MAMKQISTNSKKTPSRKMAILATMMNVQ